ncbi:MAG: hypothetical protein KGL46_03865 [Hyphomicrobiales bacterium]|nr:hypothetical protein [Hyphomicrobiales bacterium]
MRTVFFAFAIWSAALGGYVSALDPSWIAQTLAALMIAFAAFLIAGRDYMAYLQVRSVYARVGMELAICERMFAAYGLTHERQGYKQLAIAAFDRSDQCRDALIAVGYPVITDDGERP